MISESGMLLPNELKRVIVFGGAGFIGSHLLKALAAANPQIEFFSVDIAEPRFKEKDTIKSCGYVKDLVSSMLFMAAKNEGATLCNICHPERYTSEDICAAFSEVAGYKKPRIVAPISLMLLGGLAFEVLGKLGLKTTVNRARVKKLFRSTNIIPKTLQEPGLRYSYSLPASLADWRSFSAKREFV